MGSRRTHVALAVGLALTVALPLVLAGDARSAAREAPAAPSPGPLSPAPPAPPSPSPASSEPVAAPPPPRTAPPAPPSLSEPELTARVRALVDDDPAAALRLADACDRRFPAAGADERSLLRMRALVHLGRIGDARSEAEQFFERFPGSPHRPDAYRLTGVHPRPAPPSGSGSDAPARP